jgi:hypothetical protein
MCDEGLTDGRECKGFAFQHSEAGHHLCRFYANSAIEYTAEWELAQDGALCKALSAEPTLADLGDSCQGFDESTG